MKHKIQKNQVKSKIVRNPLYVCICN